MDDRMPPASRANPWIMRTYAGHSTAAASNALYRTNLERGQTGLSVAFDLPTQTGYDSDHPLARGEVGKVGVPVGHLGAMRSLFEGIPLERMNTSMTINATAPWLFALYAALAEERKVERAVLAGTTQNDIVKEYLSRGTYIFPPGPSVRLTADLITYTVREAPRWNPINICSYHLQEAGATPVQEIAYTLLTATAILDAVRARGVEGDALGNVVGRISFFVNAGIRFVEEMCKLRAFVDLWDRLTRERYGVVDPKHRRFRYGVQVNSLGLTEQQPENNIIRIVLEMLAVTLSKDARARAVQLPAWNEALGLPRPWDQQWSLRAQQILAYETDVLEGEDLFAGSHVVRARVRDLGDAAWAELEDLLDRGGAIEAVESGIVKHRLVQSNAARIARIAAGDQIVVGVNAFTEAEASPLVSDLETSILVVDPAAEAAEVEALDRWRRERGDDAAQRALDALAAAAASDDNIVPVSIAAAHAGVTTGEWGATLRRVFGEYRAPTGVGGGSPGRRAPGSAAGSVTTRSAAGPSDVVLALREEIEDLVVRLGRRPRMLVGKPGLDGHSNGAEQIAIKAREVGFDVVYEGIRVTVDELVRSAIEEGVHLVGLSVLSGSHEGLVTDVLAGLERAGVDVPVVVGGIIPDADAARLRARGVARVYTPKDFELDVIMADLVGLVRERAG
jgi:(2R)-ethylmalonyl-CoA mutase